MFSRLTVFILVCGISFFMSQTQSVAEEIANLTGAGHRLVETESEITIYRGRDRVLVYNKVSPPLPEGMDTNYRRSGFLHPVLSPAGRVVTATFPFDHPHQHGVFSAWVNTQYGDRKVDFWNLVGGTGRVLHERVDRKFADEKTLGFEVDLLHRATQSPAIDVLRERWKITVSDVKDGYCFDLESTQTALTDTPLVIEKYHYGGMAFRGPVGWLHPNDSGLKKAEAIATEPSDFLNDLGSERRKGNHERANWVALHGEIDGKTVSVTVLGHPGNLRAPQAARLHPTKPYFCYTPCVGSAFSITKENPLSARYRYIVTDAAPDSSWLNEQWATFAKE